MNVLTLLFKSIIVFLAGIPITLLGLIVVAIALPFRKEYPETRKPFLQYPGEWMLVRLPSWALLWDNPHDGAWGDRRGWWDNECGGCSKFINMYNWMAIRNPANYWSRRVTGVDVSRCEIVKLGGKDVIEEEPGMKEWQFLVAIRDDGTKFHRFWLSWAFGDGNHAIMIDIGWKIKLAHNAITPDADENDRIKGSVFTLSPYKALR